MFLCLDIQNRQIGGSADLVSRFYYFGSCFLNLNGRQFSLSFQVEAESYVELEENFIFGESLETTE